MRSRYATGRSVNWPIRFPGRILRRTVEYLGAQALEFAVVPGSGGPGSDLGSRRWRRCLVLLAFCPCRLIAAREDLGAGASAGSAVCGLGAPGRVPRPERYTTPRHRDGCGALVGWHGGVPGAGHQGHGTAKCSARWASTCTGPCTAEHTWRMSGPEPDPAPRLFDSRTPSDLGFCGAPGRIRTCDHRIRSPVLYPLSYGCSIQLSPAMAGRDHAVTRGRGKASRAEGGAGAGRRACGREDPCRGAGGVPGRHSRVFA